MSCLTSVTCLLLLWVYPQSSVTEWKPIDAAQLALKTGVVEPDADAEAIFWEVMLEINDHRIVTSHYLRIKIFTERGRETQSKVDLPYSSKEKVEDIAGRTIKSDGKVIYLDKSTIFDHTVVKAKKVEIRVKSFALPQVEPGTIIEYRWREVGEFEPFIPVPFQRDIPVQFVEYTVKAPLELLLGMTTRPFNMNVVDFSFRRDKSRTASLKNVVAFHLEPDMPPPDVDRPWVLLYFPPPGVISSEVNKFFYEAFKSNTRLSDELRKTTAEVVGDAGTPDQKIHRIFDFCHKSIKRIDEESGAALDRKKSVQSAAETLRTRSGTKGEINRLFAALCLAAGLDARLALSSDRSNNFFDPAKADSFGRLYFLRTDLIAVSVLGDWRFFDPGSVYVPYGMLPWQKEATGVLIVGPDFQRMAKTELSPVEKSYVKRDAKLRLTEDGTIEGDVRVEYYGHLDAEGKEDTEGDSPSEREKSLKDAIKRRMSSAELSDIRIDNAADPLKPLTQSFHVKVPGYAQRTGKRIFFQPAFFQTGMSPRFTAPSRRHQVYFHYPWKEEDKIEIELPSGFELDHAESIGEVPLSNVGKYEVNIGITRDRTTLVYKRDLVFGLDGRILFPVGSYTQLKKLFDTTHELDGHTITLKQTEKKP
jgi:uncharacterized protein DUF3857/transglutaminase superfamily protein